MKDMLNTMFTVREMAGLLNNHHIQISEQMIRRYLRQGKIQGIRSSNRKEGWTIPGHEVFQYWDSLQYKGTIYEDGIDDEMRLERLFAEVKRLKQLVSELEDENYDLRVKLGLEDGLPF